jgi:hypothetical protein
MEVRANEVPDSFKPLHQVFIPALGPLIGDIFDLEAFGSSFRWHDRFHLEFPPTQA